MKRLIVVCGYSLLLISAGSYAGYLQQDMVLKSVENNYPLVIAAEKAIETAEANYLSSKGGFDPKIKSQAIWSTIGKYQNGFVNTELMVPIANSGNNFFTGYRIGRGDFPVYDQGRWTYHDGEVRMGVEIPMLRNRSIDPRRGKIKQSAMAVSLSEVELNLQKLQTKLNATIAYWTWYEEARKLSVMKGMVVLANQRKDAIEKGVIHGDLGKIESTDNNRIIQQRQFQVDNQYIYYQKSAYLLSLFYRDRSGNPIQPTYNQAPDFHSLYGNFDSSVALVDNYDITKMVEKHPYLEKMAIQKEMIFLKSDLASNNLMPELNSRIYVAQDLGGGSPPLNRSSINYELTFELPIYQREARGEVEAAKKSLLKLDAEQKLIREQLIISAKDAMNQVIYTKKMLTSANKAVLEAKKVERAEEIKFEHGDSNLVLVNQREIATAESELMVISAVASYYKAKGNLMFAIANLKSINQTFANTNLVHENNL